MKISVHTLRFEKELKVYRPFPHLHAVRPHSSKYGFIVIIRRIV